MIKNLSVPAKIRVVLNTIFKTRPAAIELFLFKFVEISDIIIELNFNLFRIVRRERIYRRRSLGWARAVPAQVSKIQDTKLKGG